MYRDLQAQFISISTRKSEIILFKSGLNVNCLLFSLFRIISMNGGSPPLTYKRFQSVLAKMEAPSEPEETINSEFLVKTKTPIAEDHDDKYGVPTLEELG